MAQEWLAEVRKGGDPSAAKNAARKAPTMKEFCHTFMEDYSNQRNKPSTQRGYQGVIDRCIIPIMGRMKVQDVKRPDVATTERLIAQARGLAYDVTNLDREFARLYPEQYAATVSGDQMYRDAQERWLNTLNGLQTTMQMQAQVSQNLSEDESVLADLVGKSQSAEGALQAMQATNQLLSLQAKQSIQSQRLQITQDRAASLELARQAAATERAREVRRRTGHGHQVGLARRRDRHGDGAGL